MKQLSKLIFWITGWKIKGDIPSDLKHFILIAAPHTSNWDFIYARAAFFILGINVQYTVKKELFFFPLNLILKSLGGIPIDRTKRGNMVQYMSDLYGEYDELCIMITPEGSRSYAKEWKKGFYHIANTVEIPIALGFLDYKKKHAGIGGLINPSGDYEKDLEKIKSFYRQVTAKYPEKGVK